MHAKGFTPISETVPQTRKNSTATRARLLRAAEACFADHGFNGVSLRQITRKAGVNLAAVNYHFSSKKELWLEVMKQRTELLNAGRKQMLAEARAATPAGQPLPVEKLCEAFLLPIARVWRKGRGSNAVLARMISRVFTDPKTLRDEHRRRNLDQVIGEFRATLGESLPGISDEELDWKLYFLVSAMMGAIAREGRQAGVKSKLDTSDLEALMQRLVVFVSGGLQAGLAKPAEQTL
jgi:AcrR family transcriptional regulator